MIYESQATVWVVRRDGWMRRMQFALPLQKRFHMAEPMTLQMIARASDAAGLKDEPVNHRTFELVETVHRHLMPWAEPCFYREL